MRIWTTSSLPRVVVTLKQIFQQKRYGLVNLEREFTTSENAFQSKVVATKAVVKSKPIATVKPKAKTKSVKKPQPLEERDENMSTIGPLSVDESDGGSSDAEAPARKAKASINKAGASKDASDQYQKVCSKS